MLTGLFVKMSNGATYSVVPFVNKRALGAVAGIVGAGGNVGAVLAGVPVQDGESFVASSAADSGRNRRIYLYSYLPGSLLRIRRTVHPGRDRSATCRAGSGRGWSFGRLACIPSILQSAFSSRLRSYGPTRTQTLRLPMGTRQHRRQTLLRLQPRPIRSNSATSHSLARFDPGFTRGIGSSRQRVRISTSTRAICCASDFPSSFKAGTGTPSLRLPFCWAYPRARQMRRRRARWDSVPIITRPIITISTRPDSFPKQLYVRFKHLGGLEGQTVQIGRFTFLDGSEVAPKDATLAQLKRDRVSQRLLGDFGWSDVGRSFDGVHYSLTGSSDDFTFLAATPTRGVFQTDGWGWNKVAFGYAAYTHAWGKGRHSADTRVFDIEYDDWRHILKTDNRPAAVRKTDTENIVINTVGGHTLHAIATGAGTVDALAWGAFQTGRWGTQQQLRLRLRFGRRIPAGHSAGGQALVEGRIHGRVRRRKPNDKMHETFFQICRHRVPTPVSRSST